MLKPIQIDGFSPLYQPMEIPGVDPSKYIVAKVKNDNSWYLTQSHRNSWWRVGEGGATADWMGDTHCFFSSSISSGTLDEWVNTISQKYSR